MWREPLNLVTPLTHDRLWYDDQRLWFRVGNHGRDELDRLAQTHFVTQKSARIPSVEFALHEPPNSHMLVRRNQTSLEH